MTNIIPHTYVGTSVSVVLDGKPQMVSKDDLRFTQVMAAIKNRDVESLRNALNLRKAVTTASRGRVDIRNGRVYYQGLELHNSLTRRIVQLMREGYEFEHMVAFLQNVMESTSHRVREQLFDFVEKHLFSITEDGCFLAYKYVDRNFRDCYSGKFDNRPGRLVPETPLEWNDVDEDPNRTCSRGLHVCGYEYLKGMTGSDRYHIVLCKVDPRMVAAIPVDYNHAKMRVRQYEVLECISDTVDTKKYDIVHRDGRERVTVQRRDRNGLFTGQVDQYIIDPHGDTTLEIQVRDSATGQWTGEIREVRAFKAV